ncbi:hypothetical protein DXG01_016440 [Tephrocybe rancida]|nr:hypothetical protein DXG01_016440 [Tephrocybe rancida]
MRAMSKRDMMHSVGNQIGVGKESDIYIVADSEGQEMVLKLHRRQIAEVPSPGKLYSTLMDLIVRFARAGLIHGDFNNILIRRESGEPIVIDFPQLVSTSHENAEWFQYESALYPRFRKTMAEENSEDGDNFRLDVVVAASGFERKDQKVLEDYMETVLKEGDVGDNEESEESEEEDEDEGEDSSAEEVVDGPVEETIPASIKDPTSQGPVTHGGEHAEDSLHTDRDISRSPPQSRPASPDSLAKLTSAIDTNGIKSIITADLTKSRAAQQRKYHSKRGARRAGWPQGSKAKQDTRVKLDRGGMWD